VTTTSAPRPNSARSSATTAPSANSGSQRSVRRFHTVRGKPAARMLPAIGRPIRPMPTKPTFISDAFRSWTTDSIESVLSREGGEVDWVGTGDAGARGEPVADCRLQLRGECRVGVEEREQADGRVYRPIEHASPGAARHRLACRCCPGARSGRPRPSGLSLLAPVAEEPVRRGLVLRSLKRRLQTPCAGRRTRSRRGLRCCSTDGPRVCPRTIRELDSPLEGA